MCDSRPEFVAKHELGVRGTRGMDKFPVRRRAAASLALALLTGATAALFAGAGTAPGQAAEDVSVTPHLSGFDKVQVAGAFETHITAGAATTRIVVSGSRAAVDRVTTEVKGHTLVVGMRSGMNLFDGTPTLTIALPALRGFSNQGAGSVKIGGLAGGDVAIENDGAASITASGSASHLSISLNGVGKVDTTALDARDATVDNDGVGSVRVRASGSLSMNVNGVGEIRYAGKPAHVQSAVNGIGSIRAL